MAKTDGFNIERANSHRTMEEQKRIDDAREHYRTRANRRRKGESRTDLTKYYPMRNVIDPSLPHAAAGLRRIPRETLQICQMIRDDKYFNQ